MARAVWMAVATLALAHVAYGISVWSGSVDCPAGQVVSDVVGEFGGGGVAGCNAVSVTPVLTRLCSGRCATLLWCGVVSDLPCLACVCEPCTRRVNGRARGTDERSRCERRLQHILPLRLHVRAHTCWCACSPTMHSLRGQPRWLALHGEVAQPCSVCSAVHDHRADAQ
jgi:hypothetical protein